MIAVAYIEGNQQYMEGQSSNGNSKNTINEAMQRIISETDTETRELFIKQVRQGFFHDGITRKDTYISGTFDKPLEKRGDKLLVNPHKFLDVVKQDFEEYIKELKVESNTELRSNFERFWDFFKGI